MFNGFIGGIVAVALVLLVGLLLGDTARNLGALTLSVVTAMVILRRRFATPVLSLR